MKFRLSVIVVFFFVPIICATIKYYYKRLFYVCIHAHLFVILSICTIYHESYFNFIFRPPEDLPKPTLYENIPSKEKKISAGLTTVQNIAPIPPPRKTWPNCDIHIHAVPSVFARYWTWKFERNYIFIFRFICTIPTIYRLIDIGCVGQCKTWGGAVRCM